MKDDTKVLLIAAVLGAGAAALAFSDRGANPPACPDGKCPVPNVQPAPEPVRPSPRPL